LGEGIVLVETKLNSAEQLARLYPGAEQEYNNFIAYIYKNHRQSLRFNQEIIDQLLIDSFSKKQTLKKVLNLGDNLRRDIPFSVETGGKPFFLWIRKAISHLIYEGFMSVEDNLPFYKLVSKINFPIKGGKGAKRFLGDCIENKLFPIKNSKNSLKITKFFSLVKQIAPKEYTLVKEKLCCGDDPLDLLALFYALPNIGTFTLTANPFDLLLLSENALYKVCTCLNPRSKANNIDADYSNGLISYCRDKFTLAALVLGEKDQYPKNRRGRLLLHVMPEKNSLILGRRYGEVSHKMLLLLQKELVVTLNKTMRTETTWYSKNYQHPYTKIKKAKSRNLTKVEGAVYFDKLDTRIVINRKELKQRITNSDIPTIQFEPALCFRCGKNTYHTSYWQCKKCAPYPYKCRECRCRLSQETDFADDSREIRNHFCERCYGKTVKKCGCCNKEYYQSLLATYQKEEEGVKINLCLKCLKNYTISCSRCTEVIYINLQGKLPDEYICNECVETTVADAPNH